MTKEELQKKRLSAINLGCDKNKVDLEKMLGQVRDYGIEVVAEPESAEIVIVNTCAFIRPAQEEAIDNILEMEALKKKGVIEKLIVSGCFPERNYDELKSNFPLVDKFMRLRENRNIVNEIEHLYGLSKSKNKETNSRVLTSGNSYAYIKIADGCNNSCSYCTIPRIRGLYKSEPMDEIVDEAKYLAKLGIKELILVAQDTTRYGVDLYGEPKLLELCQKLCKVKGIEWIRVHYLYPELITDELLEFFATNEKMCPYLDIPLQHIDDEILISMRRRADENETRQLIERIKKFNNLSIRSTFIVGYPGERRAQFKKLCKFIKETTFDYAGFFQYSKEPNTAAFYMTKQISNVTKRHRYKAICKIQNKVYTEKAASLIGTNEKVLIDRFDESDGTYIGHTKRLSPGVDFGVKVFESEKIKLADFVEVKILDFDGSNYIGEVI